jgi:hypothetical protein
VFAPLEIVERPERDTNEPSLRVRFVMADGVNRTLASGS